LIERAVKRRHIGACRTRQRQHQNENNGSAHRRLPAGRIGLLRPDSSSTADSFVGTAGFAICGLDMSRARQFPSAHKLNRRLINSNEAPGLGIPSTPPLLGICGVFASGKMNRVRQDDAPGSPAAGNARSESVTGRKAGAKEHQGHDAKHLRIAFFVPCSTTQRLSAAFQIKRGPAEATAFSANCRVMLGLAIRPIASPAFCGVS
jgi:hypothetical protein